MSELLLIALACFCLATGLVLGFRSIPRRTVGPASAPRRRAQGLLAAGLILPSYLGLFIWFIQTVTDWPGAACHGRGCTLTWLRYSPSLLDGGWREIGLFLTLWFLPLVVAVTLLALFVAKRGIFENPEAE